MSIVFWLVDQRPTLGKHTPGEPLIPFHFGSKDDTGTPDPQSAPVGQFSFELLDVAAILLEFPKGATNRSARFRREGSHEIGDVLGEFNLRLHPASSAVKREVPQLRAGGSPA